MNELMVNERIARWLVTEAPTSVPGGALEATFARTRALRQGRTAGGPVLVEATAEVAWSGRIERKLVRPRLGLNRRAAVLTAAVLVLALAGGYLVAGARRATQPPIRPSAAPLPSLAAVQPFGTLSIAVSSGPPQALGLHGQPVGFDVDVASDVANRLGARSTLHWVSPAEINDPTSAAAARWDLALPSTPAWTLHDVLTSRPYYAWPHAVVVAVGSPIASIDELATQAVCAVDGDAGVGWLAGRYGDADGRAVYGPPRTTAPVAAASDYDCLAMVASGEVAAAVTARLSEREIAARTNLRVLAWLRPEPRVIVVPIRRTDAAELVAAIDGVLGEMRSDGRLTRLSTRHFGVDLTSP